jgi:hypothetical protein
LNEFKQFLENPLCLALEIPQENIK